MDLRLTSSSSATRTSSSSTADRAPDLPGSASPNAIDSGQAALMRIESSSGDRITSIALFLTESEASELRDALDGMLADRAAGGSTSRHEHVSSADYRTEITVAWEGS